MSLPKVQPTGGTPTTKDFVTMQSTWAKSLDPLLIDPMSNGNIIKNVQLLTGNNTVNHLLGRKLQGWVIVRQRGPGAFYDLQESNQLSGLTLILYSSTMVSVDIFCF